MQGLDGSAHWLTMHECFGDHLDYKNPGIRLSFFKLIADSRKVAKVRPKLQRAESLGLSEVLWNLVRTPQTHNNPSGRARSRGRGGMAPRCARARGRGGSASSIDGSVLPSAAEPDAAVPSVKDAVKAAWSGSEQHSEDGELPVLSAESEGAPEGRRAGRVGVSG